MLYIIRFLNWLLWLTYTSLYAALLVGTVGGAIAVGAFRAGYSAIGAGVALVTLALELVIIVTRSRDLAWARAIGVKPPDTEAFTRQALAAETEHTQQYADALPSLQQATELAPDDPSAWASLARALNALRRPEEALVASERALALDSNHPPAWARHAGALLQLGRTEEGLAACEHALALDPDDASAWANKAGALQRLNRPDEALSAYDHVLAFAPDADLGRRILWLWYGEAVVLHRLRRYGEAVEAYDKALAIEPNLAMAWFYKANALHALGREKQAWAAIRRAKELSA